MSRLEVAAVIGVACLGTKNREPEPQVERHELTRGSGSRRLCSLIRKSNTWECLTQMMDHLLFRAERATVKATYDSADGHGVRRKPTSAGATAARSWGNPR